MIAKYRQKDKTKNNQRKPYGLQQFAKSIPYMKLKKTQV